MRRYGRPAGSLRGRVAGATLLVVAVTLVVLLLAVDALFGLLARNQAQDRLVDRAQFAVQLDRRKVMPDRLVRRVSGAGIEAVLVDLAGRRHTLGGFAADLGDLTLTRRLPGGGLLTLYADTETIDGPRTTLRMLMLVAGLLALAALGFVLPLALRRATRPMDDLAGLARQIAQGQRGKRLAPERTDTELGRTAAAFDSMLDSLEGAEQQARESENRSRQFLADVAHELRTPLAGIQATAEAVLQAPAAMPAEERERMQLLLVRETRRAGRLVDDLLALARIDAGLGLHREPVQLRALCEAEADRVMLRAPEITVAVEGEEAAVIGDAQRLGQIIANLLDNARRHTPPDGLVTVTVKAEAGEAVVDVADTGPGVPPSARDLIFHRFVRRDTTSGGAGLGLPIARGLALAHGGTLTCEESPSGAVFRLRLPAWADGSAP
ncbi:ATP-binding protein [Nonomuraea sp. NPDC050394]|uniref:HAMP domain-containing sensor histidine kinase n=1 Tax=Nonomuraea sp. NPDC050394 TaxID=3364363 RepID=UPI0037A64B08